VLAILGTTFVLGVVSTSAGPVVDPLPLPQGKVYIPHRGGGLHLIDLELLWEIQKRIIDGGGLPTPGNVDQVYDEISNGF
jgi:hypothetical protein